MREKPILFYRSCWRDAESLAAARAIKKETKAALGQWRRIQAGPLRGCFHQDGTRTIIKVFADHVLEFHLCIRPGKHS